MKTFCIVLLTGLFPILVNADGAITWDTITFEAPYEFIDIDTSGQCIWQIAEPEKIFFNAAFAGEKAIITDSSNTYSINNNSYFDLKIGAFNVDSYSFNTFIELHHKYDTDESHDGGYITVSIDSGKTWTNIINATLDFDVSPVYDHGFGSNENLYTTEDTLYNGEHGFSGHSDGWVTTSFGWGFIPMKAILGDTMILRFNFISDGIETGKEGWMIDNIRLYAADLGGGAVHDFRLENLITVYPNPAKSPFMIKMDRYYSIITVDLIDLKGTVLKESHFYNTDCLEYGYTEKLKGIFFLKITVDDEKYVMKRIIF